MREWTKEDLGAVHKAIRNVLQARGIGYWYDDLAEQIVQELSPRYLAEIEQSQAYVKVGLFARVTDAREGLLVAWCSTLGGAKDLVEILNRKDTQ